MIALVLLSKGHKECKIINKYAPDIIPIVMVKVKMYQPTVESLSFKILKV